MRLRSAILMLLFASAAVLHAERLGAAYRAVRRHRRVRRRIASERALLARLERAMLSTDAGWTRGL